MDPIIPFIPKCVKSIESKYFLFVRAWNIQKPYELNFDRYFSTLKVCSGYQIHKPMQVLP